MGLKEVQEDLKKQLAELEEPKEEVKEEKKEEAVEVSTDGTKEATKEEVRTEPSEEKPKTNSDFARERRERLAEHQRLREELAAANARIEEMQRTVQKPDTHEAEPDKDADPIGWADWRVRQAEKVVKEVAEKADKTAEVLAQEERRRAKEDIIQRANDELLGFEESVRRENPDYDDAKKFYANMLAFSIKNLNPRLSNDALVKAVNNQILLTASQYLNDGHENPVQAMYETAKTLGFRPVSKETPVEEIKPDLSKVAKNRERNAGTAASAGGSGKGELTKHYAATELTSAEWAKLPVAERERLMRQA